MSFKERLNYVLGKRALTVWGRENKLSGGTISRISTGNVPGHQILNLMQKLENVSMTWLVDGVGKPFIIHDEYSDSETAGYLHALFDEEWRIDVLADQTHTAIICTQPSEIDFKKKTIPYTIIEVICSEIGHSTIQMLEGYPDLRYQKVSTDLMRQIYRGEFGTFKLVGDEKHPGLIEESMGVDGIGLKDIPDPLAEDHESYHQPDIFERYNQLNDFNKDSISLIIDTLLKGQE